MDMHIQVFVFIALVFCAATGFQSAEEVLVFRQQEGCGGDPWQVWTGISHNCNITDYVSCNWKSPLVERWENLTIYRVIFALYQEDREVKRVVFNGRGSNKNNWFSSANIIQSSWNDLNANSGFLYDSINGWTSRNTIRRAFYMQHLYGGCPKDVGWFGVTIGGNPCVYEAGRLPIITFASTSGKSLGVQYDRASEFRIYIKMN